MIVHSIVNKISGTIKVHKGVARNLFVHGRGGLLCIVVPRVNHCLGRQAIGHVFQSDVHLLRVTTAQVTTATAENK